MGLIQHQFIWGEFKPVADDSSPPAAIPTRDVVAEAHPEPMRELDTSAGELAPACTSPLPTPDPREDGLPIALPLRQAVDHGIFGLTTDGPMEPDTEQVVALTEEHAYELTVLLADAQATQDGLRGGYDPRTGRTPRNDEARTRLIQTLTSEQKRLMDTYADALAAYAEGFGEEAAAVLDDWVRKTIAGGAANSAEYEPTHPWHYYHAGDNAAPAPVEQIPVDEDAGKFLERDLPKNSAKRLAKLRELLTRESEQLDADKQRYADIVERGAEALSRYDREIAHSSDAMARASALALKHRHVSLGLGRVQWIAQELRRLGNTTLFAASGESKTSI